MYEEYAETWSQRNRKEKRAERMEKVAIVVLVTILCLGIVLSF